MGKIEQGIPIPERWGNEFSFISEMEVGDSVLVELLSMKRRAALQYKSKKLRVAVRTKAEADGTRIWRVA